MNERERKEIQIFSEALAFASATERADYLNQTCGKDEVLRQKVQALLQVQGEADRFFGTVTSDDNRALVSAVARSSGSSDKDRLSAAVEVHGTMIGRYKLLQKIGEGGCGVVYMAGQEEPVRRRVALKIIKLGMDTKSVIARFEAERQALALMDHPNIAKVHDAGATETGRPYFVMELVRGVKITDYCDEKNLSTQERLDLFVQVCHAVKHAHQKGIIHRDLKPSNILVNIVDGQPVPKVIDFGIAKATNDQRLTDKTVFTAFEQFIGTPAYMSPEQAEISGVDVDTRSDIYSLGVLLYELLTSKTPFDAKELLQAGLDEMRRTIREREPARPSTRVSTLGGEELTSTAKRRGLEAPKLINTLRGDLDWIVMKCLEKDRARRYETANGLAQDIERHLNDEPVVASPPGNLYRIQKLVHRNKLLFAAAGAVLLALILGLGLSSWFFFRERAARKEQARLRQISQAEAAARGQEAQLLQEMITGVGPSMALGRDTTLLREILDRTANRVSNELTNQPGLAAEMCHNMAIAYSNLGLYQQMAEISDREVKFARASYGPEHPGHAVSLGDLGSAYWGMGNYEQAEAKQREALAIFRKTPGTDRAYIARSLAALGPVLRDEGKLAEAEKTYREALTLLRERFGENHAEVARVLSGLGVVLHGEGKLAYAQDLQREALEIRRKLFGSEHPEVATSLHNLATLLLEDGELAEAESMFREALEIRRKLMGDQHPEIAYTLVNLAEVFFENGKPADSESCYREALVVQQKALGVEHPLTTVTFQRLISILVDERKFDEAERLCREELSALRAHLPTDEPRLADTLARFADILLTEGKFAEVDPPARECLAIREKKLPEDWRTYNMRSFLGRGLLGQQKYEEAQPMLLSGYEGMKQRDLKIPFGDKKRLKEAIEALVQLYEAQARSDQAAEWKRQLEDFERTHTNRVISATQLTPP
jgi:serine/threonine protein kinase/tetratricopeptide (TPR) repeat protein